MLPKRFLVAVPWLFATALSSDGLHAENYPVKPLRILTSSAGSGVDLGARLIAQGLTGSLGQQVVVENRAGNLPAETVAKAAPDGYTLLVTGTNTWIEPLLQDAATYAYDVVRDFAPVTLAAWQPGIMVVHPSMPVRFVKDLIAIARAKPGVLNFASAQRGASNYLAAELFKSMAGVNIVNVSYSSTTLAIASLIAGDVHVSFPTAGAAVPHMKSSKLNGLAVTSIEPSPLFPGLPTVAASLPGYEAVSIMAIYVPAKTPANIVSRLQQEIVRVLGQSDVEEKFTRMGISVVASSPEQLAATVKSEVTRMGKIIRETALRGK